MNIEGLHFEEIDTRTGTGERYIGWGQEPGQAVIGIVQKYDETGGKDFNGRPCPELVIETLQATYSVSGSGRIFEYQTGTEVTINASQSNLRRGLRKASPAVGDVMAIKLADLEETENGTVKIFEVRIARGGAAQLRQQAQPTATPAPVPSMSGPSQEAARDLAAQAVLYQGPNF